MKAESCKLEIVASITEEEMQRLEKGLIEGDLTFRNDEETRDIAITILRKPEQRELVEVTQEPPEVYFGKANKATFSINPQFYDLLLKERYSCSRFYGATGRLEITVE